MSPDHLRATADAHRDAHRWEQAEAAYRAYLTHCPDHWQIHVQLGHAVKQLGEAEAALAHYARAAALVPDEADPPFQAAHTLRQLGRGGEAAQIFARLHARAPGGPLLRHEATFSLHRLIPPPDAASLPAPPMGQPTALAFDVTDLLDYLRESRTPTGIQRVVIGLLGGILEAPDRPRVVLVAYDASAWRWWQVDEAAFRHALALSRTGARADDPEWTTTIAALTAAGTRPDAALPPGATLATLGNAWGVADYFLGLRLLRRAVPIRYVAFLHDCVPLAMPEHCRDGTPELYARWFSALALHADGLLANSHATAGDAARFGAPLGLTTPAGVIPLAAEPPETGPEADAAAEALEALRPGEPFVLFVATIESRKNHLLVLRAWLELIRRHGPGAVPRLVLVGRDGWHAEAALDLLARAPELHAGVLRLSGVSDLALAGLIARCLFTVYNSFHEGWGLPVSESLAAGVPCVVPAHSALLESGAPGAVFFPPGDLPALVAVLERLIRDPAHRAGLAARIDRAAATRDWPQAAAEALAALTAPPLPGPRPCFPLDLRVPLGAGARQASLAVAWGEAVRAGRGWWAAECWGCWTRDGVATLALPVEATSGTLLRVTLELRLPVGAALRLRLRGGGAAGWQPVDLPDGAVARISADAATGPDGLLLDLDAGDGVLLREEQVSRVVGVGVIAVIVAHARSPAP